MQSALIYLIVLDCRLREVAGRNAVEKRKNMAANFRIVPEAVGTSMADTKLAILEDVAAQFAAAYAVDQSQVLESLQEREALGSTGFGRGVAIPHARSDAINRPAAIVLKLQAPVDFGAADGMDVDVVFGLLSPVNAGASHLHALAAISRIVRDEATHDAIVAAPDAETIYALLTNVTDCNAA